MARWNLAALGMIALLALGGPHFFSPQPAASADAPAGPVLVGNQLTVVAKDHVSYRLESIEVQQLGGRTFLVGRDVSDQQDPAANAFGTVRVWVPIDAVVELVEPAPNPRAK